MIIIHPYGGLCNRMRCVDSGVHLARELKRDLTVVWQPTEELNATFEDLFCPQDCFDIRTAPPAYLGAIAFGTRLPQRMMRRLLEKAGGLVVLEGRVKERFLAEDMQAKLARYRHVYIYSSQRFMYPEVYDAFTPVDRIQRVISAFTRRFDGRTVGVHIRRQDHETAIQESPLSLFTERIEAELEKAPGTSFFVATDDGAVKHMLTSRFGTNIITQEAELTRKTQSGVAAAVVDLYALARTNVIWGSVGSSFCETAQYIGGNDLILLRRSNHKDGSSRKNDQIVHNVI